MATRPVSGATRPASSAEQRGFPRAVAAHHPDPVPGRHAERDAVEQRAVRVRLGRLLQADQVHHGRVTSPRGTMAAPGTGPVARATERHTPAPDSDTARSRARSALAARNTQVGPEPATSAPSAPSSRPGRQGLAQRGEQRQRGRLQVVAQRPADLPGIARAQRRHERGVQDPAGPDYPESPGSPRPRDRPRWRPAAGPAPRTPRGWTGDRRRRPAPSGRGRRGQRRRQPLAPAPAHRGPAEQREGHVAAHPGRDLEQLRLAEAAVPQLVAGDEGRGRVGAAAGQPGRHRDPLGDRDVHARGPRRPGPPPPRAARPPPAGPGCPGRPGPGPRPRR